MQISTRITFAILKSASMIKFLPLKILYSVEGLIRHNSQNFAIDKLFFLMYCFIKPVSTTSKSTTSSFAKFAERLKELRLENNLTQEQLGIKVGLTHTAISYWEAGKRMPSIEAVVILSKFFKVSLDYMVGLED